VVLVRFRLPEMHPFSQAQRDWSLRHYGSCNQGGPLMLSPLPIRNLPPADFIPQAIFGRPASYFANTRRIIFIDDWDDFDRYEGAAFSLNGQLPFALKHYRGHPTDTLTLYLPSDIRDVEQITQIISAIMKELELGRDILVWQRADDPNL